MPWVEVRAWVHLAIRRRRETEVAQTNQRNKFETLKKWYGEAEARKRLGL